jgi:hypothetical protein
MGIINPNAEKTALKEIVNVIDKYRKLIEQ